MGDTRAALEAAISTMVEWYVQDQAEVIGRAAAERAAGREVEAIRLCREALARWNGYAIKGRYGLYEGWWMRRRDAVAAHTWATGKSWAECYKRGDRVIKVLLVELTPGAWINRGKRSKREEAPHA